MAWLIFERDVDLLAIDLDMLVADLHLVLGPADGDLPLGGRVEPVAELAVGAARAVGFGARHEARDRHERAAAVLVGVGAVEALGTFPGEIVRRPGMERGGETG